MEELAREFDAILAKDFPNANLRHAPHGSKPPQPTIRSDIQATIARLESMIETLKLLQAQL
jgi:hypothetical protein